MKYPKQGGSSRVNRTKNKTDKLFSMKLKSGNTGKSTLDFFMGIIVTHLKMKLKLILDFVVVVVPLSHC